MGRHHDRAGQLAVQFGTVLVLSAFLMASLSPWLGPELSLAIVALLGSMLGLVVVLINRRGGFRLDDAGLWHGSIVLLYALLPVAVFVLQGMRFTESNALRLYQLNPTTEEVAAITAFHALYFATFAVAYLMLSRRASTPPPALREVPRSRILAVTVAWATVTGFLLLVRWILGTSTAEYADTYLVIQSLPLYIRQALKISMGMQVLLDIALMTVLFREYPRRRWLLLTWFVAVIVQTIAVGGARTGLMMFTAALVLLYNRFRRPIGPVIALTGIMSMVIGFTVLGQLRSGGLQVESSQYGEYSTGEFESVFANGLDLRARKLSGSLPDVPASLRWSDALAAVPSQLLPFEKSNAAEWYLNELYPEAKARGGGFAFGVVSQAIIGLGAIDVILSGIIVGVFLAWVQMRYARAGNRFWTGVVFVWVLVGSYQAVRATTFYPITALLQQALPGILLVEVLALLFRTTRRPAPGPYGEVAERTGPYAQA